MTYRLDYQNYEGRTKMEEFKTRGELQQFVNAKHPRYFRAFKIKNKRTIGLIANLNKKTEYITFLEK